MSDKDKIKELIEKLISEDISENEIKELDILLKKFPEYKEIVQAHDFLSTAASPFEEPVPEAFSNMRYEVLRSVRNTEMNTHSDWLDESVSWVRKIVTRPEMAVAAFTLILGFFLGRIAPVDQESISSSLMQQVSFLASENESFADTKNSPYQYSNIEIKEINGNQVALNFDVSTHLEMVRDKNDPLVREVIAQSLLNPTNLGTELKAISYSENMLDRKLKEALIYSMRHAPILAVRQNAMRNLTRYDQDDEIKEAFLKTLTDEESVKMKLMALDYLDKHQINPDELRPYAEMDALKKSPAVLIKVKKYLENK
jgi:hypothetical protein